MAEPKDSDAKNSPVRFILRSLPYVLATALSFYAAMHYGLSNPAVVDDVVVKLDVLGITHIAAAEQKRLHLINELDLPFEKKQVLANKTIFIGADRRMTLLALGQPRNVLPHGSGKDTNETWVYHFYNDPRPTMLSFENGNLTNAYKGSQADLAELELLASGK